ncbi:23S rRNA (adenine(2030)-N(6))-methyltransferase RlmJ [Niveispirillum lacus]|uniref:Ribosomal RNA large subunit methyltransferase J n=1 Tax=Niveispirillum lacus TaxID=1981099 RepID=A0A255Z9W1_9PROT|nr:23S rRNA (adenine(2030)-N(6))-methyltransferase RlmJ [Niveispirillum lacus]OYQ37684.1 23S rRNA (adenine(2030)-N(6))-methyltransferase RlmJ [Niveispirillum lacus]
MNYRHAFHAGNAADVMKHAVLAWVLERLRGKEAPFFVLDTHAGIGRYDLDDQAASRTGEALRGVRRVIAGASALPDAARPYLDLLARLNEGATTVRHYPGSPLITRMMMRGQDRLLLAELHAEDVQTLRNLFRTDAQVSVHHMDGWLSLKAHLPPKERRGLVVIDPPFEAPDEYERMVAALVLAYRRWATGQYLLWYPVKDRAAVWRFHQMLEDTGIPKMLSAELCWSDDDRSDRLNGSGLILVNPPWKTEETLSDLLPALQTALAAGTGPVGCRWLRDETGKPA